MNIAEVLTLMNSDGINSEKGTGKEGTVFQTDINLFSLFLNSIIKMNSEAAEQQSEGRTEGGSALDESSYTASGIMGQNAYLQILQNYFPAGKEANSGLQGDQILNGTPAGLNLLDTLQTMPSADINNFAVLNGYEIMPGQPDLFKQEQASLIDKGQNISVKQEKAGLSDMGQLDSLLKKQQNSFSDKNQSVPIITSNREHELKDSLLSGKDSVGSKVINVGKVQDTTIAQKNFGLEGITNPKLRESSSLDSTELDKHIKTSEQFRELSGKIEVISMEPKRVSAENGIVNLTNKQENTFKGITENQSERVETNVSQDGLIPLRAAAEGKEQQRENQPEQKNFAKQSDYQPLQAVGNKVDEVIGLENSQHSRVTASSDSGEAWEQVLDILKKQELNNIKEIKKISIELQPAELGKVQVSLRMENGQIHLVLNASEQATGTMLQNNLHDLKNGLAQMGVACGSFEMSNQTNGEPDTGREYAYNDRGLGYNLQEEESSSLAAVSSYYSLNGSGGRINVSA